jgi:glutamate carboxypeptidase
VVAGPRGASGERILARTKALVEAESHSGDPDGLRRAFDLLTPMVVEASGRVPGRAAAGGVPYLHLPAERDPSVLLLCHLDTVWPRGSLRKNPFSVTGDRATGPGIFDMKAGLALGLEAMSLAAGADHAALLVTGDEELGSGASRAIIEAVASRSRAVFVLEGAAAGGDLKSARKGVATYDFEIVGRASHAGLEPEAGVNATAELAALISDVLAMADRDAGTSVTPTLASAGTTGNTVPDRARLHVDVRAWTLAELERVDGAARSRAPAVPGAAIAVRGGINRPPMEAKVSAALLDLARRAARETGLGDIGAAEVGGGSDGNLTSALGIPTIDGFGAVGGGAHADDEWISVAALAPRARLIARLIDLVVATS